MKSIALFDFDNTLYHGFSYFALLQKQVGEGIITQKVLDAANAAMTEYKNGQVAYEPTITKLLDIYAEGLAGQSYDRVYQSTLEFYKSSTNIYPFAAPVFALLRPTHDLCLVTGEPQFIAEAIQALHGFSQYYASQYEVADGVFTGKVTVYLASRHEKHDAVQHLLSGHAVKDSFAFGDSEGDMEMLGAVENPICINATPGLQEKASQHGWVCVTPEEVESAVQDKVKVLK